MYIWYKKEEVLAEAAYKKKYSNRLSPMNIFYREGFVAGWIERATDIMSKHRQAINIDLDGAVDTGNKKPVQVLEEETAIYKTLNKWFGTFDLDKDENKYDKQFNRFQDYYEVRGKMFGTNQEMIRQSIAATL